MSVNACTIIAKNYVAQARVLARSFARHHPDGRFSVLILDELEGRIDPALEPFEVLSHTDLELPEFADMASRYDVLEMSTAVKPWLLRRLLRDADHVMYLDPDIEVFATLEDVASLAREHGMVLTPHNTTAMPRDGRKPSETDILIAGSYNLGFIALGARPVTDEFLDWWSERLLDDCVVDTERGYFVDQRWIDLVPGIVPDLHLLRDAGYNVAYWNLHSRRVERAADGSVTVNGRPLRFFHFSGYDPAVPDQLSKHQDRVRLEDEPVVRELCDAYGAALLREGHAEARRWPYTYARAADGLRLDRITRKLFAEARRQGAVNGTLFDRDGVEGFVAWAAAPAGGGADPRINRWMAGVREVRDDLRAAYPDLGNGHAEGYLEWLRRYAREQLGEAAGVFVQPVDGDGAGATPEVAGAATPAAPGAAAAPPIPAGVNLVGYLTAELGVGEVARQATQALDAAGVPVLPVRVDAPHSRQGHAFASVAPEAAPFAVNLLCVNADQTPAVAAQLGPGFFAGRRTVGWWWWEVPAFPSEFHGAFSHVDEVWAGSRFIADTLARVSPVPVVHVPTPVAEPRAGRLDRAGLGIPEGFLFLFAFDFHSVLARKNPLGLVEAFRRAFAPEDGAVLVVKAINGEHHPEQRAELAAACADRDDVVLLDRYLSPADKDALLASCDAYVSLHRSEGFGYTMAEAMLLGRPVVATAWSGNADYVTAETAFPVRHRLVPIGEGHGPYPADAQWAEPDLDHAAEQLRLVLRDPTERARRAAAGQAFVREHHSPAAAGAVMAQRIGVLAGQATPPPDPIAAREVAAAVLRRGPVRSPRAKGDPRRVLRAALLRAAKPILTYQHEVARATLDAAAAAQADAARRLDVTRAERLAWQRAADRQHAELHGAVEQVALGLDEVRATTTGLTTRDLDPRDVDARVDVVVQRLDELGLEVGRQGANLRRIGGDAPAVTADVDATRYPPADGAPWDERYVESHAAFVAVELDDPVLLERFRAGAALPMGFGVGYDERVVEFPWTAAQRLAGTVLDAGSTLNHAHVLARLRPRMDDLHVVTLAPEPESYTQMGVSYLFSDLRDLPVRDGTYDRVVSLSTVEHIGLDNEHFGAGDTTAADPQPEAVRAIRELRRVLRRGGELLLSVPVGRPGERYAWVRALTLDELDELADAFGAASVDAAFFRYGPAGWRAVAREDVADARYRDHLTAPAPSGADPVAAEAVACLRLVAA